LALTNSGELWAFGSNCYGQLGLGNTCEKVSKPTLVKSLAGIPLGFFVCGNLFNFLTKVQFFAPKFMGIIKNN
jgi:E3 ubiquitin-protein ligase HERC4